MDDESDVPSLITTSRENTFGTSRSPSTSTACGTTLYPSTDTPVGAASGYNNYVGLLGDSDEGEDDDVDLMTAIEASLRDKGGERYIMKIIHEIHDNLVNQMRLNVGRDKII